MLSVIIADDEQEVIHLCRMLIEYPVDILAEAHNGEELLEQIDALHPDLVITDICMPGLNGIELIKKVKDRHPNIKFVSFSGGVSKLEAGESANLPKLIHQAQTALSWKVEEYDDLLHVYSAKKEKLSEVEAVRMKDDLLKNALQSMDEARLMEVVDRIWDENYAGRPGEGLALLEAFGAACERICNQTEVVFDRRFFCGNINSHTRSSKQLRQNILQALVLLQKEYKEAILAKENSTVSKAKQYVEKNYGKEGTLNEIAKYVCLSPAYFSTIFKMETGVGFVKYLQHVRIEKAKMLLRESHMSVEVIAHQVGYKDVRFFKQLFKSETNVTPKEYRKFYT